MEKSDFFGTPIIGEFTTYFFATTIVFSQFYFAINYAIYSTLLIHCLGIDSNEKQVGKYYRNLRMATLQFFTRLGTCVLSYHFITGRTGVSFLKIIFVLLLR